MTERSLTFRILTVAETAALDATTDALDDVARAALDGQDDLEQAGQALDDLGRDADTARRQLDDLDDATRAVDLEQLGDQARTTARDVDDGFDAMARSAAAGSTKIKAEAGEMRRNLRGVSDEAGDTAREAAASFSSTGDIGDALQEVAANAPATLGPLGLAFGTVAAVGVGLFRTRTEALKDRVGELVDAMIDAGGRITSAMVDAQVLQLVKDGEAARIKELAREYSEFGLTYRDLIRARAGDETAIERVTAALDAESARRKTSEAELARSEAAVTALTAAVGGGAEALALAKEATGDYEAATQDAADATVRARGSWEGLDRAMSDGITAEVTVNAPSAAQLDAIRRGIVRGIGPIRLDAPVIPAPRSSLFYRRNP